MHALLPPQIFLPRFLSSTPSAQILPSPTPCFSSRHHLPVQVLLSLLLDPLRPRQQTSLAWSALQLPSIPPFPLAPSYLLFPPSHHPKANTTLLATTIWTHFTICPFTSLYCLPPEPLPQPGRPQCHSPNRLRPMFTQLHSTTQNDTHLLNVYANRFHLRKPSLGTIPSRKPVLIRPASVISPSLHLLPTDHAPHTQVYPSLLPS